MISDDIEVLYDDAMTALAEEDVDEAMELRDQMVTEAPDDPHTLEVQGDIARFLDDVAMAEHYYGRLLEESTEDAWKGAAHYSLAALYGSVGNFEPVASHFLSAIDCFLAAKDLERAAQVHTSLGVFEQNQGDFGAAVVALDQARTLLLQDNDGGDLDEQLATVCQLLGVALRMAGKLERAKSILQETLKRFEDLGDLGECADTLDALGVVEQIQGNYDAAEELHEKSLALNESIEYLDGMSVNYGNLTMLNIHRKQYDQAAEWAQKAFEVDDSQGNENGVAHFHLLMGEIECERGNLDEAESHLNACNEIYEECGDAEDKLCVKGKFAFLYRLRGEWEKAFELNQQVLMTSEEMDFPDGIAATLDELAHVSQSQGKLDEAREFWERSLATYEQLDSKRMIQEIRDHLAKLG